MSVAGLLLAAGAGRRMGTPKALLRDERDVPYVDRALGRLLDGGCDLVTVVLGAAADEVRAILDEDGWCVDPAVDVVVAEDWAEGMGASLRAGLRALAAGRDSLARASYDGVPGHPVLLGRGHWAGVVETATGDRGARDYLRDRDVLTVECGDLATGRDVDTPGEFRP